MRTLIVDDSKSIRMLLSRMLRSFGHQVTESCHGGEALEILNRGEPFDLALFDWNMPVMNGYDLLKAVRADEKFAPMRILMVTTETEVERFTAAIEAGASEYRMKPFSAEALAAKLELIGITSERGDAA